VNISRYDVSTKDGNIQETRDKNFLLWSMHSFFQTVLMKEIYSVSKFYGVLQNACHIEVVISVYFYSSTEFCRQFISFYLETEQDKLRESISYRTCS
jgi:hypothetical protein